MVLTVVLFCKQVFSQRCVWCFCVSHISLPYFIPLSCYLSLSKKKLFTVLIYQCVFFCLLPSKFLEENFGQDQPRPYRGGVWGRLVSYLFPVRWLDPPGVSLRKVLIPIFVFFKNKHCTPTVCCGACPTADGVELKKVRPTKIQPLMPPF